MCLSIRLISASGNGAAVSHSTLAQAHQLAMAQAQAAKERAAAKLAAAADKARLGLGGRHQKSASPANHL